MAKIRKIYNFVHMTSSIDIDDACSKVGVRIDPAGWLRVNYANLPCMKSHALSQKYNYFHPCSSNLLMHGYFEILHHIDRKDEYKLKEGGGGEGGRRIERVGSRKLGDSQFSIAYRE